MHGFLWYMLGLGLGKLDSRVIYRTKYINVNVNEEYYKNHQMDYRYNK